MPANAQFKDASAKLEPEVIRKNVVSLAKNLSSVATIEELERIVEEFKKYTLRCYPALRSPGSEYVPTAVPWTYLDSNVATEAAAAKHLKAAHRLILRKARALDVPDGSATMIGLLFEFSTRIDPNYGNMTGL